MSRQERRKAVRVARPIEIEYESDSPGVMARIEDLSERGLYLDTTHPLTTGDVISFKFYLPDSLEDTPIEGRAKVVWTEPSAGVGLEFQDLTEEDVDRIRFFVSSVLFGDGADEPSQLES